MILHFGERFLQEWGMQERGLTVHQFSSILIDFNWFSLIFIFFHVKCFNFHWFSFFHVKSTRGRRILILKSGIGFRILARPTDRIRIPDFRIRIPDICHINIQWIPLYSTPHAVDSRLNPIYFFATYFLPLIKDAAYYRHSLLKHIFSPWLISRSLYQTWEEEEDKGEARIE